MDSVVNAVFFICAYLIITTYLMIFASIIDVKFNKGRLTKLFVEFIIKEINL